MTYFKRGPFTHVQRPCPKGYNRQLQVRFLTVMAPPAFSGGEEGRYLTRKSLLGNHSRTTCASPGTIAFLPISV